MIPRLYDGHNRTFFFASYEGLRERSPQINTIASPQSPSEMATLRVSPRLWIR